MRRVLLGVSVTALLVIGWSVPQVLAQSTKSTKGTVTAIGADSVTVKVGTTDMKFSVDEKTFIQAVGASTKSRQAAAAGKAGPKLSEVLSVGQNVEVSYTETASGLHAAEIKRVSSAAAAAGSPAAAGGKSSVGKVTAVTATSLSISGSSSGGATFTQTFTIDPKTTVTGRGAGTAAAAKGGKTVATDLVGVGDTVSVSYREEGTMLHAGEVRVTAKAVK